MHRASEMAVEMVLPRHATLPRVTAVRTTGSAGSATLTAT
jgi:hypothetical protein